MIPIYFSRLFSINNQLFPYKKRGTLLPLRACLVLLSCYSRLIQPLSPYPFSFLPIFRPGDLGIRVEKAVLSQPCWQVKGKLLPPPKEFYRSGVCGVPLQKQSRRKLPPF